MIWSDESDTIGARASTATSVRRFLDSSALSLALFLALLALPLAADARCITQDPANERVSVWQSGAPSDTFALPEVVSGGVQVTAQSVLRVDSTSSYGKLKIASRRAINDLRWVEVSARSRTLETVQISLYLYTAQMGDLYSKRCQITLNANWQHVRVPMTALGVTQFVAGDQIRFRNESNRAVSFEFQGIAVGANSTQVPPVDPPIPGPPQPPTGNPDLSVHPTGRDLPSQSRRAYWHELSGARLPSTALWRTVTVPRPRSGVDASAVIQRALDGGEKRIVQLEPGEYTIRSTIRLTGRDKLLRGASRNRTTLRFVGIRGNGIQLGGDYTPATSFRIVSGRRGTRSVDVGSSTIAQSMVGRVVEIDQLRDTLRYDEPNRTYRRGDDDRDPGQLNRVVSASGSIVRLEQRLILDYGARWRRPEIRTLAMYAARVGVESLRLRGTDIGNIGSAIFAKGANNIWIKQIDSVGVANKSHVELVNIYQCTLSGSRFDNAVSHVNGGAGYGVNVHSHTTGCLIENNRFSRLRHSMILNLGAAGNAVMYNYSSDPIHPNYQPGGPADISFHGGYVSGTLVEGNVVQGISMSDDCCRVERYNTLLRNCIVRSPILIRFGPREQNLIGNATYGDDNSLRNTLIEGGALNGVPVPGGTPALRPGASALFDTTNGQDGIFVYANDPATRLNESTRELLVFKHWHNGHYWTNGLVDSNLSQVPRSYFYLTRAARARSSFTSIPPPLLRTITGDAAVDCRIPAADL